MNIEIRLRALERCVNGGKLSPTVSLVFPTESGCELSFGLWGGITGSGKNIESTHGSEAAALAEYERMLSEHHIRAGTSQLIIIDV